MGLQLERREEEHLTNTIRPKTWKHDKKKIKRSKLFRRVNQKRRGVIIRPQVPTTYFSSSAAKMKLSQKFVSNLAFSLLSCFNAGLMLKGPC